MSIAAMVYTGDGTRTYDDLSRARDASGTTWVRATAATRDEMQSVATTFDIHDLELEDVRNNVRPKVEVFTNHTFILVKTARLRRGDTTFEEEILDEPLGLFFGTDWVVTMSPATIHAVDAVWDRVEREEPRLLARGPDFTAYRVLDLLVDSYFDVLDEIEDDIEHVEDDVMATPEIQTLEDINSLRRELLAVRRILWPTRDATGILARGDTDHVMDASEKYYRDVYDHLVQLVDLTETYRDLASSSRDIYLNRLSQSTNEVMKTLTVVATVVLPLTFVVGVYGMNFGAAEGASAPLNMPELTWQFGYPAVMLGMACVATIMLGYFRKRGWL